MNTSISTYDNNFFYPIPFHPQQGVEGGGVVEVGPFADVGFGKISTFLSQSKNSLLK